MSTTRIPLRRIRKYPFLKADYVIDGETATIAEEPYIVPREESQFNTQKAEVPVTLTRDKTTYTLPLNIPSSNALVSGFSEMAKAWLNKKIVLHKRTMVIRGVEREVILVEPVSEC
jgi:hypothetical protein